ncbi:MAG: hypothetical protein IKM54_04330 [Butyricicoccus sp.]|nr:hypothetical protein [Butyricicoccus sp.]
MGFFWECLVGTLAAVGLICILKSLYDIIVTDYMTDGVRVELLLYGDRSDPHFGRLLRAVLFPRCHRIRISEIYFVDTGIGEEVPDDLAELLACGMVTEIR